MRRLGLRGLHVHCLTHGCGRRGSFSFDALGLADATVFVAIATRHRRFVCRRCGRHSTEISPDWRDHVARGNGSAPLD